MTVTVLLGAIALLLLFVGIGAALRRFGVVERDEAPTLTAVIIYVALPALIFTSVARAPISVEQLRVAGIAWAVSLAGLSVAWEMAHLFDLPPRTMAAFVLVAALGNTGFIGYPVAKALLGEASLPSAVFYDVFGTVAVLFTLGIAVATRYGEHEGRVNPLKELFTFPATIALLVALGFRLVPRPTAVSATVMDWTGTVANVAVPLIMIALGISLDFKALKGSMLPLGVVGAIKLLMLPALAVAVATFMKDTESTRLVALQAGMPSVLMSLAVGQRFKLDTAFIAAAILLTTIGCLVTVPLVQLILP